MKALLADAEDHIAIGIVNIFALFQNGIAGHIIRIGVAGVASAVGDEAGDGAAGPVILHLLRGSAGRTALDDIATQVIERVALDRIAHRSG